LGRPGDARRSPSRAWRLEPDPSPGGRHQRRGGPAAGRGPHLPERGGTGTGRRPDRPRRPVRQPGRVVPAGLMPSLWTVLREWGRVVIRGLAALFLTGSPPVWVKGAGAGAGAAVAAVAVHAGWSLLPASWRRAREASRIRFAVYLAVTAAAAALLGPWLVLVLLGCGVVELVAQRVGGRSTPALALPLGFAGGSVAWVAFKVGALS